MKTITSLLVFTSLMITLIIANNPVKMESDVVVRDNIIFDGKEGNHYFFTDMDYESITIEDDDDKLLKAFKLDPNSYIGNVFRLTVKVKSSDKYLYKSDSVVDLRLIEPSITNDKKIRN